MLQGILTPIVYQVLLIVHVMASVVWLSATASVPRRVREALSTEVTNSRMAATLLRSAASQRNWAAYASGITLLTGVVLALHLGFPRIDVRYHIALTLALIWFVIDLFPARANMKALLNCADSGSFAAIQRPRKRLSMFTGMQHLLFAVNLIIMLWRI